MPQQGQGMSQQGMTQQQVYNPLNPMAGKYAPMPAQMGQMGQGQMGQGQGQYKNPMMERPRQNQPQMGQYYRGPSGA